MCTLSSELLQCSRVLRAIVDSPYVQRVPPSIAVTLLNAQCPEHQQETLAAAVASLCDYEATLGSVLRDVLNALGVVYFPFRMSAAVLAKCNAVCVHHQPPDTLLPHENMTDEQTLELRANPLAGWNFEFVRVPLETLFELIAAVRCAFFGSNLHSRMPLSSRLCSA